MKPTDIEKEIERLKEILGFPGEPKICVSPNCYNKPASGMILCLQCLYGLSPRAEKKFADAKKKLGLLEARQ